MRDSLLFHPWSHAQITNFEFALQINTQRAMIAYLLMLKYLSVSFLFVCLFVCRCCSYFFCSVLFLFFVFVFVFI